MYSRVHGLNYNLYSFTGLPVPLRRQLQGTSNSAHLFPRIQSSLIQESYVDFGTDLIQFGVPPKEKSLHSDSFKEAFWCVSFTLGAFSKRARRNPSCTVLPSLLQALSWSGRLKLPWARDKAWTGLVGTRPSPLPFFRPSVFLPPVPTNWEPGIGYRILAGFSNTQRWRLKPPYSLVICATNIDSW